MLGVAGLVDLLGEQEGFLVLVLGGEHEAGELAGDALLADEEGRQAEQHLVAQLLQASPPIARGRARGRSGARPSSGAPTAGRARSGPSA